MYRQSQGEMRADSFHARQIESVNKSFLSHCIFIFILFPPGHGLLRRLRRERLLRFFCAIVAFFLLPAPFSLSNTNNREAETLLDAKLNKRMNHGSGARSFSRYLTIRQAATIAARLIARRPWLLRPELPLQGRTENGKGASAQGAPRY